MDKIVLIVMSIIIISCASCGPTKPGTVTFAGYNAWEQEYALDALYALGFNPSNLPDIEFSRLSTGSTLLGQACVDCSPCKIQINRNLKPQYYITVVWHEYGHCMGYTHAAGGIMEPAIRGDLSAYTQAEIDQFKGYVWNK